MADAPPSPESAEATPDTPPPRRGLGRKLLLSAVAVLVALAVAEGALHVLGIGGRAERLIRDPAFGWRNRPGWRGPKFGINSLGFLGEEFDPQKPDGVIRIFCLGCSCTAGDLLPSFDDTYPRQLERILRERHPGAKLEVINAGVGGYSSFHGRLWLEREIVGYAPDLVVVYFGWNDHWPARLGGDDKTVSGSWSEHARAWFSWCRLLQLSIRAVHTVRRRGDRPAQGSQHPSSGPAIPDLSGTPRVSLDDYRDNLRATVRLARGKGAGVAFITAPNYIATGGLACDDGPVRRLIDVHADYNAVVRSIASAEQAGLIDAAAELEAAPDAASLFWDPPVDYIHLSAKGYRRLAERVAASPVVQGLFEGH